jgi:hypothetical protein
MTTGKHDHHSGPKADLQVEKLSEESRKATCRLRAGMTCPHCKTAILDYNGMLQLACPCCGILEVGVFT